MSFISKLWKQLWNPVSIQDVLKAQLEAKSIPVKTISVTPDSRRILRSKGFNKAFRYEYIYPHIIPMRHTHEKMRKQQHPLRNKLIQRYNNIDPNAMWACFYPQSNLSYGISKKGIVGSKERSRLKGAFRRALTKESLDKYGRHFDDKTTPSPLKGTLIFWMLPDILDTSTQELESRCHIAIKNVIKTSIHELRS
jgi:hypothetical protein